MNRTNLVNLILEDIRDDNSFGYLNAYIETLEVRIDELEQWVAAIADDHPQIPDWIQQSARSLLARGAE